MPSPVIVWLRQDLRLSDNPALHWAAKKGPILPIYIFDRGKENSLPLGGASKWWLKEALPSLAKSFLEKGVPLIFQSGDPIDIIAGIAQGSAASAVACNACYEPDARALEARLARVLEKQGQELKIFHGSVLFEPGSILNRSGKPFKVFTPFSRACFSAPVQPKPLKVPSFTQAPHKIKTENIEDWALVPKGAQWTKGLKDAWEPSEKAGMRQLKSFASDALATYPTMRNRPDHALTSRLSPYLHFGHLSPRQVWHQILAAGGKAAGQKPEIESYLREILWREFSINLLVDNPHLPAQPLDQKFSRFPWRRDEKSLRLWQKGKTGYPIVDAGMRELWLTGWMHNRVRMITASFLIKHLLIDWRLGAAWFWDTLVDADLASNSASWQWVAGSGADAAPYFRIFNPILQGKKFDPAGAYVRRYLPELAKMPNRTIHEPWNASESQLKEAGVILGKTYPLPIVEHVHSRERALAGFKQIRKKSA